MLNFLKRTTSIIFVMLMFISLGVCADTVAEKSLFKNMICLKVNGNFVSSDTYVLDNEIYIPLRAVYETMGSSIKWNESDYSVNITSGNNFSKSYLGDYKMPVNSEPITANVHPDVIKLTVDDKAVSAKTFIYNDTTYIALSTMNDIIAHAYIDYNIMTLRIFSDSYKAFNENEVIVYGNDLKLNLEQFNDIVKFLYGGNVAQGLSQGLTQVDNYFLNHVAVTAIADKYKVTATKDEINEFVKKNNVEETITTLKIADKECFINTVINDYTLRDKLFGSDFLSTIYTATDAQIEEAYQNNPKSKGVWMQAQHILIPATEDEKADLKKVDDLLAKVNAKNADFTKIMLENSTDPGSKSTPDGYIFTEGQMVEEFYKGALDLKAGEISKGVKSEFGYHIIKKVAQWDNGIPLKDIKEDVKKDLLLTQLSKELNGYYIDANVFFNDKTMQSLGLTEKKDDTAKDEK